MSLFLTVMRLVGSMRTTFSRISVKSQTVLPKPVRDRLGLEPGDVLRYRMTDAGVLIDRAVEETPDDPFATFSEWSGEADERGYRDL